MNTATATAIIPTETVRAWAREDAAAAFRGEIRTDHFGGPLRSTYRARLSEGQSFSAGYGFMGYSATFAMELRRMMREEAA